MSADAEGKKYDYSAAGGTTDATPYSFLTVPMNNTASAWVEIFVIARRWDMTDSKVWVRNALLKRNGAQSSLSGTFTDAVTPRGDLATAAWDIGVIIERDMSITCTGAAGAEIFWYITVTVKAIESK